MVTTRESAIGQGEELSKDLGRDDESVPNALGIPVENTSTMEDSNVPGHWVDIIQPFSAPYRMEYTTTKLLLSTATTGSTAHDHQALDKKD